MGTFGFGFFEAACHEVVPMTPLGSVKKTHVPIYPLPFFQTRQKSTSFETLTESLV